MKSKVFRNLTIMAATAVPPCGMLAYLETQSASNEVLPILALYLLAHTLIWLALIPAFRKFPRTSWALCTVFYPMIGFGGMLLLLSAINPYAFIVGLLWFGPSVYIEYGWLTVPTSGICATIAYHLTRITPDINPTDRGLAAPSS